MVNTYESRFPPSPNLDKVTASFDNFIFFSIRFPPKLLPVLGLLEQYMTPTLDAALLFSSRAGSDLGHKSDRF